MIKNFLIHFASVAIVFYILPSIDVAGADYVTKGVNVFVIAVIIGALNLTVKPIISLITLPLNIITLGLFSLVINALIIKLADIISPSFAMSGFFSYVIFGLLLSLVHIGLSFFKEEK